MTTENESEPVGEHRQQEIYANGMVTGQPPEIPVQYPDLRDEALETLEPAVRGYLAGGAGSESTMAANRDAFEGYQIVPRLGRDVANRSLSVTPFDKQWPFPVALAPVGVQSIIHDDGVLATARATNSLDIPLCVSSVSSVPLERVGNVLEPGSWWFQLYYSSDPAITESLLERAQAAGCGGIIITLDVPILGWRERDLKRGYLPFLDGEGIANFTTDPAFRDRLGCDPETNEMAAIQEFLTVFGDPTVTWDDLETIRSQTELPVVFKGICHPDDARRAIDCGADGVVVSNHGGRQLDRAVPALEALEPIVDAIGDHATIWFDSGIRSGSDIAIALALGADVVGLGRPYCYGLALAGSDGVEAVCRNILAEFDLTLANAGITDVTALDSTVLKKKT
ncbi:alpha-hydroxy-acid oxidizing protein [Halocatena halophila]|uniref:alpha-hydroxy-acid oxidizing protein n=1 Tax=Halocatena halophila TaxID=2814576 RepID=UPI002ED427CC